jgi:outer membrane lipoprotein-sorting protein
MHKFIVLLFFIANGLFAQIQMSPEEAALLRNKVKAKAATTKTITSDFVQYKHLDFLSNDIKSNGKLVFRAPDKVKWEYISPFEYSILFKDDKLFIDDGGNKSNIDLGSNKIFKQLSQLIAASISGDMFIAEEFNMEYFKHNDRYLVYFSPKDVQFAKFIKAFHITFSKSGEVMEVKMIEPSDDYTQIVFSNRIENQSITDETFNH